MSGSDVTKTSRDTQREREGDGKRRGEERQRQDRGGFDV